MRASAVARLLGGKVFSAVWQSVAAFEEAGFCENSYGKGKCFFPRKNGNRPIPYAVVKAQVRSR